MRRDSLRRMMSLADRRRAFAVATVVEATGSVPGKVGATMVVAGDGSVHGTVGGAGLEEQVKQWCRQALETATGGLRSFDLARWKEGGLDSVCGGTVHVAVQVHRPLPHLLLFGGGHCGQALAHVAATLDWDVTVVDARPEYANAALFPDGTTVECCDPVEFARTAPMGDLSHAYLLGHSHDLDVRTLAALLPRFEGFVGAIGSKAKRESFQKRLGQAGVDERNVQRLQCPIGVDVGAETPQEIAVAVAADVVASLKSHAALAKVTP